MTLDELQPYLAVVSATLSVATLGFILNIVKGVRDNAQDRIAVQEERLRSVADDRARLKEWSEREATELRARLAETKGQVDTLLKQAGIDPSTLLAGKRISESASELQSAIASLTAQMQETMRELDARRYSQDAEASDAGRTIAMATMARGDYDDAAAQYDWLAGSGAATWEDHFTRGVAHANARHGRSSDVAALVAYSDAVALMPDSLENNRKARLFTYKAAILKRLGRLAEALNDLSISLGLASHEYERMDAHYNLACICAMQGDAESMYEHLEQIRGSSRFRSSVSSHLDDYFVRFRDDPRLMTLLNARSWHAS